MDSQLHGGADESTEFLEAFEASLLGLGQRRLTGKLRYFYDAFDKSWKQACDKVHAYIDVRVKHALEKNSRL